LSISNQSAPNNCAKISRRKSASFSGHFFPQWRHVRGGGWIFLRSSIESFSRLLSNGLARFKEAARSKRKRACDRDESDNSFHRLTIEGCVNSCNRSVVGFCIGTRAISLSYSTLKFKTLSRLMMKISTGALVAISILTLHK
jgi:hypothetical protein